MKNMGAGPSGGGLGEWVARYRYDPAGYVREVLGVEPDVWQLAVLGDYRGALLGDVLARRISVRSCHGPGKTAVAAWIASHHQLFCYPQKTAVTAPSSGQAFDSFYAELRHWIMRLPEDVRGLLEVKTDRVELKASPESSFLVVKTARRENPEALQGIHAEHVLLIADEASGVDESVFEAAGGSMSGRNAITLLIGNPTRTSGTFYDSHHSQRAGWKTHHVGWRDSPRVDPAYEREVREQYGEDSNVYRVRVLGEFADEDVNVVIPQELVLASVERDIRVNPAGVVVWGVDVARGGRDRSALCKRRGNVVVEPVKTWRTDDLMVLSGYLMKEYRDTAPSERPVDILVDAIGLGAGVVDRLREVGAPVRGVNVAESPAFDGGQRYRNLRTELWYRAAEWFSQKMCRLPNDPQLIQELSWPLAQFSSDGQKLQVEPKDETKKRHRGKSPDVADAFVLTFASHAASVVNGPPTGQPLKRGLKGIV
jgi:hypothetical protein